MTQYESHPAPVPEPDNRPTSGMAMTAMILGILSIPLACVGIGLITGVIALILAILAMGKTGDPPHPFKGKGLAIAGLSMGIISIVIGPICLLIGILLPALGAARQTAQRLENSTQMRGIHQGMVIYAQSNKTGSQLGWYPGFDGTGNPIDLSVENRFAVLLDANAFEPEYIVNPADSVKTPYYGGQFDSNNYSYSLLDVSEPGGRRDEWRETLNAQAIVLTDRNTASSPNQSPESVWSDQGWRGTMTRNDNSTTFELSETVGGTTYGGGPYNHTDDIFKATGTDDALMIHEGE